MLYELLGGNHVQENKTYVKGDRIETELDLTKMFKGKFKRIHQGQVEEEKAQQKVPDIPKEISPPPRVAESEVDDKVSASDSPPVEKKFGLDVTTTFFNAKGTLFKIFKTDKDDCFDVVDEQGKVLNGYFTRNEVTIYLKNNA